MPRVDDSFEGGPGAVINLEIRNGKGVDGGAPEVEVAHPFGSDEQFQIVLTLACTTSVNFVPNHRAVWRFFSALSWRS